MDRCHSVIDTRIESINFGSYGIRYYPYYWDSKTLRFLYYVDDNNNRIECNTYVDASNYVKTHIVSKESE